MTKAETMYPVEDLAAEAGLAAWERAALARYAGWAPGKVVTRPEWAAVLADFRARGLGGGRR